MVAFRTVGDAAPFAAAEPPMRVFSVLALALGLACGGGAEPTAPAAPPSAARPAAAPTPSAAPRRAANPAALAALSSPEDAALADKWLVILASERDPATPVASAAALRGQTDIPVEVRQLNSGRFKNLMPCYAITVAQATGDKAAALALSKRLKAGGFDNYVKNAGSYVGPSAAIDTFCAGAPTGGDGSATALADVAGQLWLPLDAPEAVVANAVRGAPAPVSLTPQFDAWRQPVTLDTVGSVAKGASYRVVDAATGTARTCTVSGFDALTLGVPHFGRLQDGPLEAPACGEARLFGALACDGPVAEGSWVAVGGGGTVGAYAPAGDGSPAQVEAARAALTRDTDWELDADGFPGETATRAVTVRVWKGPADTVALVEGTRAVGEGVCGGEELAWSAVFRLDGDTLGAPLGAFVSTPSGQAVGVVDVRGDGKHEVVTEQFPTQLSVSGADGAAISSLSTDYCDCPC